MHIEPAGGVFTASAGDDEVAGLNFDEIATGSQTVERGVQFGARGATGAQLTYQLFEGGSRVREPRDVFEDGGVGHLLQL